MTKHYCDRCGEEFNNVYDERYEIEINPPHEPLWSKQIALCKTCYEGFVENFMHAFDDVENT